MEIDKYKDIRPYSDEEAVLSLSRIARHPVLSKISSFLYPGKDPEELRQLIASLKGVNDFQSKVMLSAISKIISDTARTLSYSGVEKFKTERKFLYISNHRDIMLDSGILQAILYRTGVDTSEMAVGDNLITDSFIEDIARSNKMIKVVRNSNPREIYNSSVLLSEYIRSRICTQSSSVWIAQRNGRTKDGIDATEQGLLKMLDMSGAGDFCKDFNDLSIVPVSLSYEFEPCDILKTKELYISRRRKYIKSEGEDLNSILTGIMQFKGNIHFNFCDPLTQAEIQYCSGFEKNEKYKSLAEIIDNKIVSSYHLWMNNYIAYDLLFSSDKYSHLYSLEERDKFISYVSYKLSNVEGDPKELNEIFLSLYANPVCGNEKLKG